MDSDGFSSQNNHISSRRKNEAEEEESSQEPERQSSGPSAGELMIAKALLGLGVAAVAYIFGKPRGK